MARNSSGTHSLPAGNPVVSGTTASSSVQNATLSDISTEITDSLSRSGKGAMTAPLELANGSAAAPAISFDSDPDTGIYRKAADTIGIAVGGVEVGAIGTGGLASVVPGGRLTLTSATPVTTTDVTSATTVYYTPHVHNGVQLYDGSGWTSHAIASELSQTTADTTKSPAAVANNSNYDIFVWNDAGTLRATRGPAWTSDTGRGTGAGTTELERVSGRYVNKVSVTNGPAAQRGLYVGTIRSDGSAQINDSLAKRHVWNAHNRMVRPMRVLETTDSWTYSTATFRQANNSAANQLDMVIGLSEDAVGARVRALALNPTNAVSAYAGIGLDSTSAQASGVLTAPSSMPITYGGAAIAEWRGLPGLGRHYLAWLEAVTASGTTTWYGDSGTTSPANVVQSGIYGECLA